MFDTAEAAAVVGIAEGESLGFGDNIDYFRVLSRRGASGREEY